VSLSLGFERTLALLLPIFCEKYPTMQVQAAANDVPLAIFFVVNFLRARTRKSPTVIPMIAPPHMFLPTWHPIEQGDSATKADSYDPERAISGVSDDVLRRLVTKDLVTFDRHPVVL